MAFPRPIEAVVFDMDGLLVDTEVVVRAATMRAAARFGCDLPPQLYASTIGRSDAGAAAVYRSHFGPAFPLDAFLAAEAEEIEAAFCAEIALKNGAFDLLEILATRGVPCAVATSSPLSSAERHFAQHGIRARFQAIVAREDVVDHKPHPAPYLEAARRLRVAPASCLALEDSYNGVRAAHAAGMMAVMVPDLLSPTDEMRDLCVHVAESLHEVRRLIDQAGRPTDRK